MKLDLSYVTMPFLAGAGLLLVAGLTGCEVSDGAMPSVSATPSYQTAVAQQDMKDSVVGKWKMYPAVGPTKRDCSIEFKASAFNPNKGSVSTFACNLVEGLGSINGVSRINGWERKGSTIILSGIATSNIGSFDLPVDSYRDRVYGSTKDDLRFVMVRN
ncbi:hypothetical protein [Martelella endophytica]|uniref:Uncharacterized protein n=1 Tax=Martelella endophytica TaxID=1486262 RepID=A0A0D5LSX8_MAREN|nr:hypothetical protein [Martelella endophytica]AJY47314.1 hypothetical protein TM49_19225 [Martelella endophytica]